MGNIIIKTQAEWDALPKKFENHTVVEIHNSGDFWLQISSTPESSTVEARGSSRVVAWESSRVVARESSRVVARESSTVEARGSSTVEAWESSTVEAWGSSTVEARGSSRVVALGSSRVVARESSTVEAWESSTVEAFENSMILVIVSSVIIKKLLDYTTAIFKGCPINIEEKSDTSHAREIPDQIQIPFEEWLRRGYVEADGITKKLLSQKKIGEIEVFEVEEFLENKSSYVVKRGNTFSHGETIEKAIEDLRYKISDRDTSRFNSWKNNPEKEISIDEAIQAYRTITGACEMGVKQFVESIQVPEKITPNIVLKLTDRSFGNNKLREFLGV